jgi:hypothetical protein
MRPARIIDSHCHIYPDKIAEKASRSTGEFYHMPSRLDGKVSTLLARGALVHRPPRYFMLHTLPEHGEAPLSLFSAIGVLGASLVRLDPVPLTYDTSRFGYRVIASSDEPDVFVTLSVYLSLFAPGYTGYGFYTQI